MGLRVYNTLSRKKETFKTIEPKKVRMYVCGPTVYDKAHVGHAMSALVFDVIRRYLQYHGYDVRHVMNYTDVDDKIIQRANSLKVDPFKLAQTYIDQFNTHLSDLNILPATLNPRATAEMEHIIEMITGLIEKDYAYSVDGDVWKAAKPDEPAWESPWGMGRPGWHIECSAMSAKHLGEQIDIHGGGNDLIFPHHENEIAQSEALSEKQFSRYWIHNGMLQLSGEKMSKSVGNLISIEEFLSKHKGDALRMMVLNSGYRNPLTFNDEVIGQAEKALERLESGLKPARMEAAGLIEEGKETVAAQLKKTKIGFEEAMNDDFNSAGALGNLFELVRVINHARADGASAEDLEDAQKMLQSLTGVLGLTLGAREGVHPADAFIDLLIEVRSEIRVKKMWALSDTIRDKLAALGVQVEDSQSGSTWTWK
jgi:cysteinyl-tRNA synthetase